MSLKKIITLSLLVVSFFGFAQQEASNQKETAEQQRHVNVQVDIDKSLLPANAENWILYVYASKPGARLPLANYKTKLSELPFDIKLTESMYLLPHLTLRQADNIVIIAKATQSDNPHQKSSEDLIGYSAHLSFKDTPHLKTSVTIDQRDKNRPPK